MKKAIGGILLAAMLTGVAAGCSDSNKPEAGGASPASSASAVNGGQKKTELSFYFYNKAYKVSGDMPIFTKAAEATGVTLRNVAPSGGEEDQAWNLLLSSGELPDLAAYGIKELNAIAVEGALTPLDDLIAKHAPHFKAFLDSHPDIKKGITVSDGHVYVVPFVSDGKGAEGWFIRKDWLDKLGLKEPTTVDEYYQVLKAFRDGDPNGNGQKDEVPFFSRNTFNGYTFLYPLWDAYYSFYIRDGKIVYGPDEPEYKTALTEVAKWYKEGLIDKEIFTRGSTARDALLGSNLGGSTHDWFASTSNYNNNKQIVDAVPGFSIKPIAPPASLSGKVYETSVRDPLTNNRGWAVSAKAKDPAKVVQYMDYWWTEEGRRTLNFGIEGQTYDMVAGKPVFKDTVLKEASVVDYLIKTTGSQLNIGGWQDFSYEEQWTNKVALEGINKYVNGNYFWQDHLLPRISFTPEEDKRLKELLPPIETYVKETSQKWFMGGEPVSGNFEGYVARLKQMKIDEILDIYNKAYERYKKL